MNTETREKLKGLMGRWHVGTPAARTALLERVEQRMQELERELASLSQEALKQAKREVGSLGKRIGKLAADIRALREPSRWLFTVALMRAGIPLGEHPRRIAFARTLAATAAAAARQAKADLRRLPEKRFVIALAGDYSQLLGKTASASPETPFHNLASTALEALTRQSNFERLIASALKNGKAPKAL